MIAGTDLLQALPVAVYTTDSDGRITFYNDAAAEFWGQRPELGSAQWCGSWRLYWPDGTPLPHDQCPMATTLREQREVRGVEAVAERPDGTRVPFMPYPTLLRDKRGRVTGAINLLIDISGSKHAQLESVRLAAIVSSSDDAIISKTLEGRVTSWNAAATRIFGYEPEEMIGESIIRIIPPELRQQEVEILAKLRRGERIEHFDTVRLTKDGRRLDLSLTVSPLRDSTGTVIGASKVARDVTDRKRSEELQRLLFDELNHRVKNTLATIQAIASQSLLRAATPREFVASFNGRVQALSRAHDLLVQGQMRGADVTQIVREQVVLGFSDGMRVTSSGPFLMLGSQVAMQLALILHELATNARKYGALSVAAGRLAIGWTVEMGESRRLLFEWRESGVPNVTAPSSHGFGTILIERTLKAHGGEATMRYGEDGVICQISLPLPETDQPRDLFAAAPIERGAPKVMPNADANSLHGRRILLVEDEPLVAMEIESQLQEVGCEIIGPAGTVESAAKLIAAGGFDAALLDANLAGRPVDELAAALTKKGIPFSFATGYGREALPLGFREAVVLTKPFGPNQLIAVIRTLLNAPVVQGDVVPMLRSSGPSSA
jgi:PAS domain S-box-containing protein